MIQDNHNILTIYLNSENYEIYQLTFNLNVKAYYLNSNDYQKLFYFEVTELTKINKEKAIKLENKKFDSDSKLEFNEEKAKQIE